HAQVGEIVAAFDDDELVLAVRDLLERHTCGLGRRCVAGHQGGDDVDAVKARAVGESTAQSRGLHLLRGALRVVPRDRAVDDAAARVLRSADRALTSVAGALLAVRLAPAAADLGTGLRL